MFKILFLAYPVKSALSAICIS